MPAARAPVAGPPPAAMLLELADHCVQCGLCLPACPTYRLDRQEAESPRGRIALWRGLASGDLPPEASSDRHLDHCLACRACESVCPAHVRFGELLLLGRGWQRARRRPALRQWAAEFLAARPRWMDRALGLYRLLRPLLPRRLRVLPPPPRARPPLAALRTPADTGESLALFRGCVAGRYDAPAHLALERLLQRAGIALQEPPGQTCCGALHAHAGNATAAAALAGRNRRAFSAHRRVIGTASGCHGQLSKALDGVAAVEEPWEVLDAAAADGRLRFQPGSARVALHLPCTQQRLPGSTAALRSLLQRVPGIEVLPMPSGCCGAAGSAMFIDPARAQQFRQPLLDAAVTGAADVLLSANVGCRMHFANAGRLPVRHPLEFLAGRLQ